MINCSQVLRSYFLVRQIKLRIQALINILIFTDRTTFGSQTTTFLSLTCQAPEICNTFYWQALNKITALIDFDGQLLILFTFHTTMSLVVNRTGRIISLAYHVDFYSSRCTLVRWGDLIERLRQVISRRDTTCDYGRPTVSRDGNAWTLVKIFCLDSIDENSILVGTAFLGRKFNSLILTGPNVQWRHQGGHHGAFAALSLPPVGGSASIGPQSEEKKWSKSSFSPHKRIIPPSPMPPKNSGAATANVS